MPSLLVSRFTRYSGVGILNTVIHWCTFMCATALFGISQVAGNLLAFLLAATFSYFVNARFTFKSHINWPRYLSFLTFMGALSMAIGKIGEQADLPLWLTPVLFSGLSLIIGFIFSQYIVFRKYQ